MDKFRRALDERTLALIPEQIALVTVKDVDEQKYTCTCTLVTDGIDIYDVNLAPVIDTTPAELIVIPKPGTKALMCIVGNNIRNCYLLASQQAKKIVINGGQYGGLVKVNELKQQLEKTHNLLNALLQVINGVPVPEPGNGAPSALQTSLKAAIASFTLGTFDDLENNTVTHG